MPRRQEVPEQLERGPFTVGDAERVGFSRFRLRGASGSAIEVTVPPDLSLHAQAGVSLRLAALDQALHRGCA